MYDHFHTTPLATREATHEAWTLMAALAATTSTIRLGQMCTCVAYRPPAYLAKVAATIDVISGGRVDMGIGAGWYEHEYAGYGYEFLPPAGRIGQLREAIEIMKRLWTEDEVHYEGRHYRLHGAICRPRPRQVPHIPIWVAGGGEQLTLRVAARHASHTNFGPSPEAFAHKSEILAAHCRDLGTDYDAIVRSTNLFVICRETESEVAAVLDEIRDRYRRVVPEEQAERAAGDVHRHGRDAGATGRAPCAPGPRSGWATPSSTSPRRRTSRRTWSCSPARSCRRSPVGPAAGRDRRPGAPASGHDPQAPWPPSGRYHVEVLGGRGWGSSECPSRAATHDQDRISARPMPRSAYRRAPPGLHTSSLQPASMEAAQPPPSGPSTSRPACSRVSVRRASSSFRVHPLMSRFTLAYSPTIHLPPPTLRPPRRCGATGSPRPGGAASRVGREEPGEPPRRSASGRTGRERTEG